MRGQQRRMRSKQRRRRRRVHAGMQSAPAGGWGAAPPVSRAGNRPAAPTSAPPARTAFAAGAEWVEAAGPEHPGHSDPRPGGHPRPRRPRPWKRPLSTRERPDPALSSNPRLLHQNAAPPGSAQLFARRRPGVLTVCRWRQRPLLPRRQLHSQPQQLQAAGTRTIAQAQQASAAPGAAQPRSRSQRLPLRRCGSACLLRLPTHPPRPRHPPHLHPPRASHAAVSPAPVRDELRPHAPAT
mmetsp:Transcript_4018/g.12870  ORF Transcript_4018/g.12870 Transcript_4018/m.12870 type:complete len:239 (-) Transcript_4018:943-1659(-)